MTAHLRDGNSAGDLKVVFADMNIDQPTEVGTVLDRATGIWPQQVFDAAVDSSARHWGEIPCTRNRENLDANR